MQRSRKTLFGADLLTSRTVDPAHLRMQLEHDLKSKLLFFRQRYLAASQDPKRLAKLLASSLSTFLVLFRAAIKLYDEDTPLQKKDALQKLGAYLTFDASPLTRVAYEDLEHVTLTRDFLRDPAAFLRAIPRTKARV